MEFFNAKEEVIDLQLTQYGRHMLSKGKFKPAYYSFFDEDVLYNIEIQGATEEQNITHERIAKAWSADTAGALPGSPRMKSQISFHSLEKEFLNNYNKVLSGQEEQGGKSQQPTPIKNYALPAPIGTSDINKDPAPAFSVKFLQGQLTETVSYIDLKENSGGRNLLKIPQLGTDLTIEYIPLETLESEKFYEAEDPSAMSFGVVTKSEEMFIFIKFLEENAPYQKKNFDVEVFEVIKEKHENDTTTEHLRSLGFVPIPDVTKQFDFINNPLPDIMQDNVEYYFDVYVDDEIEETICRLDPDKFNRGVFADSKNKFCKDVINEDNKKLHDIYEEEKDDPGEVC
tara:strand:- start:757 stop:1782 length:1026 start_codon:yes stop_codon:yes gene_type:complete